MSDRLAVMNAGRIAQIGTPRTIYEEPADTYVADFLGVSNLMEVEVVERGTYSLMHAAFEAGIERVGTVLLGGGVGGLAAEPALRAMLSGYLRAYDEIDALIFS